MCTLIVYYLIDSSVMPTHHVFRGVVCCIVIILFLVFLALLIFTIG